MNILRSMYYYIFCIGCRHKQENSNNTKMQTDCENSVALGGTLSPSPFVEEGVDKMHLRPLPDIDPRERSFPLPRTLSAPQNEEADIGSERICSKIVLKIFSSIFLLIRTYLPTVAPFPVFFTNGLFNITTLVLLINFCVKAETLWISISLPLGYSILIIGLFFSVVKLGGIKPRYRYQQ